MKKFYGLFIPAVSVLFVILMASFGGGDLKNSNGAPAGNTNSPADGQNCTHCMGGTALPVTGWITSDVPSSGYLAGSTYTITVTATGAGNKGFEVSPQDLSGALIGTLTAGTGSKLVGSNKYVTHNARKTGNPSSWTFQWTAPAGGAGNVTFYGSFIVGQSNTKTTTLVISQSTVGTAEQTQPVLSVYPNPARESFTVSTIINSPGDLKIDLLNYQGIVVSNLMKEPCEAGNITKNFPVSQPAGIYFLKVSYGGTERYCKLILVH